MIKDLPLMEFGKEIETDYLISNYENLSDFDTSSFISACRVMLMESAAGNLARVQIDNHIKYIDKTLKNLDTVSNSNTQELVDFFNSIYNGIDNKVNITIGLQDIDEIEKIRPQYLMEYVADFRKVIEGILSKSITQNDIDKKISSSYSDKMKKKLAKTSLGINITRDTISNFDNAGLQDVTGEFLQATAIPFLKSYPQLIKAMKSDIDDVKYYLNKSCDDVNIILNAIETSQNNKKLDITESRKMHSYVYNSLRIYISLTSYISQITIRKMNLLSYNIVSYYNLYNTIHNYYPEGVNIIHENVLDGHLDDISDTDLVSSMITNDMNILTPKIRSVITKKKTELIMLSNAVCGCNMSDVIDSCSLDYEYDVELYDDIKTIFTDIQSRFEKFMFLLSTDTIFDDAVDKADLNEDIGVKYAELISEIDDIDKYNKIVDTKDINDEDKDKAFLLYLYSDLSHFEDNMNAIASLSKSVYNYLTNIIHTCENNNNALLKDAMNIDSYLSRMFHRYGDHVYEFDMIETIKFIKSKRDQFKSLALEISRAIVKRLSNIEDSLNYLNSIIPVKNSISINDDLVKTTDMLEYTFDSIMSNIDLINENTFDELLKAYSSLRSYKNTGITKVYEAEETQTVTNNNTGTTNTTNTITKKSFKIIEFIKNLLDKFRKKLNELIGRNGDWVTQNKDKLLSLDTSGTNISILPYSKFDINQVTGHISRASSAVNTLNIQSLYQLSQEQLRDKIYPFVPKDINVANDNNSDIFAMRLKQFYTVGTQPPKAINISGEKVKTEIRGMISYCEGYKKLSDSIEKQLNSFVNSVDSKIDAISRSNNKPTTESVYDLILEAGEENNNQSNQTTNNTSSASTKLPVAKGTKPVVSVRRPGTSQQDTKKTSNPNTNKQAQYISDDAKVFSTTILTAIESRYIDYITTLRALISQNKA